MSSFQVINLDTTKPTVKASVSGKEATFTFSDNVGISGYGVNQSNTEEPTYVETNNTSVTWTASSAGTYYVWVKDKAGNKSNASFEVSKSSFCAYAVGDVVGTYDYTGGVQTFTTPCSGTYKLEVWGAQGSTNGGKGGYAAGNIGLAKSNMLYMVIGGAGSGVSGGYNGGGKGSSHSWNADDNDDGSWTYHWWTMGGGGGATHIATTNRGLLSNYASYKSEVLIVAGGGGGGDAGAGDESDDNFNSTGGSGGGTNGGTSYHTKYYYNNPGVIAPGGSQTSAGTYGSFGQGATDHFASSGGGGGWYGGGNSTGYYHKMSGGGSGYIGGVSGGSMQNGIRSGNGYARITLVSTE